MADDELVNCVNELFTNVYHETVSVRMTDLSTCDSTFSSMASMGNFNHTPTVSGLNVTSMSDLAN
jgi:hypothetical protein